MSRIVLTWEEYQTLLSRMDILGMMKGADCHWCGSSDAQTAADLWVSDPNVTEGVRETTLRYCDWCHRDCPYRVCRETPEPEGGWGSTPDSLKQWRLWRLNIHATASGDFYDQEAYFVYLAAVELDG